jgi:hypothetical protein
LSVYNLGMINPDDVEFLELNKGWKAMVDADLYPELSKYKWTIKRNKSRTYATRGYGPVGNVTNVYLHHAILKPKPGFTIDHKNSSTPFCVLDERRSNLRYATKLQQQHNRRSQAGSASKFKGVFRKRSKWAARIKINGKLTHIGVFFKEEDAARAYDAIAEKIQGEFFRPNFPNGKEQNGLPRRT